MYTSATAISNACVHWAHGTSHPNLARGVVRYISAFYRRTFLARSRQILATIHVTSEVNKVALTRGSYQVHHNSTNTPTFIHQSAGGGQWAH